MARNTEKPTLVQGVLIPQAVPRDTSRLSLPRIGFTLRRGIETIKAVVGRDGSKGHVLKTEHKASGASSSLAWSEGENKKIVAQAILPGDVKMTTENGSVVFTADTGATIKYHASGAFVYSPTPLKRERQAQEQAGLPFWQRSREVVENEYIDLYRVTLASDPQPGVGKRNNTPYEHFTIAIPVSETETKLVEVYAYQTGIALVKRRNLRKDDLVRLRASVQFHEQGQPGGKSILVPWLRLFDVQKIQ